MNHGSAAVMYLLIRERERQLARDLKRHRLDSTDEIRRAPVGRPLAAPSWPSGLGRLTRAITGAA